AMTVIYAFVGMRNPAVVAGIGLPQQELEFWVLGFFIATVMGGSQALSRSLFSQMVPVSQEAEFFAIYEISERGTSWLGPFVFAAVNQTMGNLRPALLSVVIFFVVGLAILFFVNTSRAAQESGRGTAKT
ncbi:MAG TPA: MFS transporter, partial [Thermoflexales bacterium]|nr:MFS transporter [Thermoflexales bacterium]